MLHVVGLLVLAAVAPLLGWAWVRVRVLKRAVAGHDPRMQTDAAVSGDGGDDGE